MRGEERAGRRGEERILICVWSMTEKGGEGKGGGEDGVKEG